MGSDRNVIILADDIDILVSRMRNDMDPRIAEEKVSQAKRPCAAGAGGMDDKGGRVDIGRIAQAPRLRGHQLGITQALRCRASRSVGIVICRLLASTTSIPLTRARDALRL